MAGIYIHIPFCHQKCHYCDFYKTVNTQLTEPYLSALRKEVALRSVFISESEVRTIYFGGGTPSLLSPAQISSLLDLFSHRFSIVSDAEITLEANPDDLSPSYLQAISKTGINRLSIGIQSFHDSHLLQLNRRHNAVQAVEAIQQAFSAGITNLSADLIYGLPGLTLADWSDTLQQIFRLPVDHLSAYHLTYHKGTPFFRWRRSGILKELPEDQSIDQFNLLMDAAEKAGFEPYEISNFARNGCYSKHNSAYWSGEPYLGLGPSAHSFDGNSRSWNIAEIKRYIDAVKKGTPWWEEEKLSEVDRFNEYMITRLRTRRGISLMEIEHQFGYERLENVVKQTSRYIQAGKLALVDGRYRLTREGIFISDAIMTDFMIV